jgi:hypothetical protein
VPSISVNRQAATAGRLDLTAPVGMRVEGDLDIAGAMRATGELEVLGAIRSGVNHPDFTPATFTLAGSLDTYYPVVFEDLGANRGELRLEVFRAETPEHGDWRGWMLAKIACYATALGQGSNYVSLEVRQSAAGSRRDDRYFVGGFENHPFIARHVLWLAGDTTYWWLANHSARIDAVTNFDAPGAVQVGSGGFQKDYTAKSAPDLGFHKSYISISRIFNEDSSPVPHGAIILWPSANLAIPLGWAICNGDDGTPNLKGQFPPSLVYIVKR